MIEQELVLLGLLRECPTHGYQIKKKISEILTLFAGVDLKSIYYPLRVLEQEGMVIKRKNRQGMRPERYVYALTEKGESRFRELLEKSFMDFKRPQFSLDLSLYFLHYLSPDIAKHRLQARMRVLERLIKSLKQMVTASRKKRPLSLINILEHNLQMVETESKFLARLTKDL